MKQLFIAAVRGYILNGANNYEIMGCLYYAGVEILWKEIEFLRTIIKKDVQTIHKKKL